jgi:hypothetical protein
MTEDSMPESFTWYAFSCKKTHLNDKTGRKDRWRQRVMENDREGKERPLVTTVLE